MAQNILPSCFIFATNYNRAYQICKGDLHCEAYIWTRKNEAYRTEKPSDTLCHLGGNRRAQRQPALGAYYREVNGRYMQVEPDDMTVTFRRLKRSNIPVLCSWEPMTISRTEILLSFSATWMTICQPQRKTSWSSSKRQAILIRWKIRRWPTISFVSFRNGGSTKF